MIDAVQLEDIFNRTFYDEFYTVLEGGADEPLYLPARGGRPARIRYREDFAASALHEVAHWCIAGHRRRRLTDYGYWYEVARDDDAQHRFETVEARPQALEWILSEAAGLPFRVSCDNLARSGSAVDAFRASVRSAAHDWIGKGLPGRASRFAAVLSNGSRDHLRTLRYRELPGR